MAIFWTLWAWEFCCSHLSRVICGFCQLMVRVTTTCAVRLVPSNQKQTSETSLDGVSEKAISTTSVGQSRDCPGGGLLSAHALSACFALFSPLNVAFLKSESAYSAQLAPLHQETNCQRLQQQPHEAGSWAYLPGGGTGKHQMNSNLH